MSEAEGQEIVDTLYTLNTREYNYQKASEELQELALVLNQKLLKPTKVKDQEIIDEIGDVRIRLAILSKYFSEDDIAERIEYKLGKYQEYLNTKKYTQI